MTDTDDAQAARWARREPLMHLLGRLTRGVLLDAERELLAAAIRTEIADGDQAHADLAGQRAIADTNRAEAETLRRRLIAALSPGTVFGIPADADWDRLIRRVEQITAGRRTWRERAEEIEADRDRIAAQLSESEALGHRLLQRAEAAEAGRVAADNVLRAVCAALGVGPDHDPVVTARETLNRADRAEAALTRVRKIGRRLAAHAVGFQDVLDDTDRDPWARMVRADLDELLAALDGDQPPEAPCTHVCGCGHDQQDHTTSGYCNACGVSDCPNDGHYPSGCPTAVPCEQGVAPVAFAWDAAIARHLLDFATAVRPHLARALGITITREQP